MTSQEILEALKRPFDPKSISWRVGATNSDKTKGIGLAYIDARDVMKRLDEVLGLNWQCKYTHANEKTICEIGIKVDGEWIWRAGGAGNTDVEAEKGAISDAFKRAAVLFGIGQYLYDLPNEWVDIVQKGRSYVLAKTPKLPAWAIPEGTVQPSTHSPVKVEGYQPIGEEFEFLQGFVKEMLAMQDDPLLAAEKFYCSGLDNDEMTYIWNELQPYSKFRTAITKHKSQVTKGK